MTDIFIEVESVQDVELVLTAVTGGVLPNGIVENTDDSYSDTVANGSTLIIPDINIIKNDDSIVTSPAAIDLDLRIIDPATAPSGWDEQIAEYGRGYNYPPPTGQTVSYRTGDTPQTESNILAPVRVANSLKVKNSLVDFITLGNTNYFGNTDRFTDVNGLQVYGDDYIIDNYTGLGWYRVAQALSVWNDAIDNSVSSSQNSFTDWFLPSMNDVSSIYRFGNGADDGFLYSPFGVSTGVYFLTGNTDADPTTNAIKVRGRWGTYASSGKTVLSNYFLCRKHF